MLYSLIAATIVSTALLTIFATAVQNSTVCNILIGVFSLSSIILLLFILWSINAYNAFSYTGKRKLSKQIVEGIAEYVDIKEGGKALDVGCGSGVLSIACAKRNPKSSVVGVDLWGKENASFSQNLCEKNAEAEGVKNTKFQQGNATKLDFPDESFDAVVSNYVYHNIAGYDKQKLLFETLRVLKKGGTFAIHDLMSKSRYGDMNEFVNKLKSMGYESVELIDSTDGKFMSKGESRVLLLSGSTLLFGKK